MLAEAKNSELVAEWLAGVSDPKVRDAFRFMVGAAAGVSSLTCHAQWKGAVRDFRLHSTDGQQPFSFITNKNSLLFYFRAPSVRSGRFSLGDLHARFSEVRTNARAEWTVKLRSLSEAQRLWSYLELE